MDGESETHNRKQQERSNSRKTVVQFQQPARALSRYHEVRPSLILWRLSLSEILLLPLITFFDECQDSPELCLTRIRVGTHFQLIFYTGAPFASSVLTVRGSSPITHDSTFGARASRPLSQGRSCVVDLKCSVPLGSNKPNFGALTTTCLDSKVVVLSEWEHRVQWNLRRRFVNRTNH